MPLTTTTSSFARRTCSGNKRTAWVTVIQFLEKHGETPAETTPSAKRVLYRIRRYDIEEVAAWLRTGDIDEDRLEP